MKNSSWVSETGRGIWDSFSGRSTFTNLSSSRYSIQKHNTFHHLIHCPTLKKQKIQKPKRYDPNIKNMLLACCNKKIYLFLGGRNVWCTVSSHFIYYKDGQQALFTLHHCYNNFCHPIDNELILPFRFGTKFAKTQLHSWEQSHILPMRKIIGTQPHSKGGYVIVPCRVTPGWQVFACTPHRCTLQKLLLPAFEERSSLPR